MTAPVVNSACGLFLLWFLGIFEQGVFASEICVFHGDVLRMLHLYIYMYTWVFICDVYNCAFPSASLSGDVWSLVLQGRSGSVVLVC